MTFSGNEGCKSCSFYSLYSSRVMPIFRFLLLLWRTQWNSFPQLIICIKKNFRRNAQKCCLRPQRSLRLTLSCFFFCPFMTLQMDNYFVVSANHTDYKMEHAKKMHEARSSSSLWFQHQEKRIPPPTASAQLVFENMALIKETRRHKKGASVRVPASPVISLYLYHWWPPCFLPEPLPRQRKVEWRMLLLPCFVPVCFCFFSFLFCYDFWTKKRYWGLLLWQHRMKQCWIVALCQGLSLRVSKGCLLRVNHAYQLPASP